MNEPLDTYTWLDHALAIVCSLATIITVGWTIGFTGWLLGQIISGGGMP